MSLRTRIIVLNAVALALALLASAVAVTGLWLALAPLRQAMVEERQALQFAEALWADRADQAAALQRALAAGAGGPDEAADRPVAAFQEADVHFDELLAR